MTKNLSNTNSTKIENNNLYLSNYFTNLNNSFISRYSNEETSDTARYLRFYNPIFKYDYKSGDYFPKLYTLMYSSLFSTLNDITNVSRKAP